jgi:hypothetical protein
MKRRNYELLKDLLKQLHEAEDEYTQALLDDSLDLDDAYRTVENIAGLIVLELEDVLADEEDHLI